MRPLRGLERSRFGRAVALLGLGWVVANILCNPYSPALLLDLLSPRAHRPADPAPSARAHAAASSTTGDVDRPSRDARRPTDWTSCDVGEDDTVAIVAKRTQADRLAVLCLTTAVVDRIAGPGLLLEPPASRRERPSFERLCRLRC